MRVLVAEDDPVIALGLAERLRTLGHEPIGPVNDGEQAVAAAKQSRPEDVNGQAFDDTAARIHSIATVHGLLARGEGPVDAGALLERIAESAPVPVTIDAEPAAFDPCTAQKLGIVANELITNAFQHGAPPIVVQLMGGHETRLQVDDRGNGPAEDAAGLGLQLVRDMVEQGLRGRFGVGALPGGGTRAAVVFPEQAR